MAVSAGTAALQVVPTLAKTFSRDLVTQMSGPAARGTDKAGKEHGRRFGTSFSGGLRAGIGPVRGILRGMGPQLAAAFGGAAIVGAIKSVTDEARESAKVGRQTAAVLKATGGVANVSARDVDRLASSLMRKVAVDDDVIATGINMMLTFKGVRNQVGRNNDIFDQATAAAVDMTAAMNQGAVTTEGLQQSSVRLGKALNDPIKGVSALSRVGVTFTQGQKDQIAAMVEAGDTMGAQRIILAELKTEFGGAAKAAVDPWQRVGVVMGEVKEQIGTALLPVLDRVAQWLAKTVPRVVEIATGALRNARDWWDKNKQSVQDLTTILVDTFVPGVATSDASVRDFTTTLGTLAQFLTDVAVFSLELTKVWLTLEHVTIGMMSVFADMNKALGHAINAVQFLTTGTKGAGDEFVRFGDDLKNQATRELKAVRKSAEDAQRAIDKLHGKNIKISATTSLQFTKTFTSVDWSHARQAAGRMATGGKVGGPPGRDKTPIWATRGEAVVPTHLVPAVAPFLGAHGVPGFAQGGAVGVRNTGQAYSGVGKMMDRWGTVRLAALVKELVSGGGPAIQRALAWARGEVGKPYVWGGVGPGGYDCSGFMSAIANVVAGRGPHRRLFATGSFPAAGWAPGFSPLGFSIGSRRGNPGHMAGTLGGVNVESRGSMGVVVGPAARGARNGLFSGIWHLIGRSGSAGGQESLRVPRGRAFDNGGWLMPGTTIARNATGQPERVVAPNEQLIDYQRLGRAVAAALAEQPPAVYLDGRRMDKQLQTARVWNSR